MMPSDACTRASTASTSRYRWIRFSSENTRRIASVLKISRNTMESIAVEPMFRPPSGVMELLGLHAFGRYLEDRDPPDPSKGNLCLEESLPPKGGIPTDTAASRFQAEPGQRCIVPNCGVAYYQTSRRSGQCRFLNLHQVNRENLPNAVS